MRFLTKPIRFTVKGNQVNYPDGLQKDGNKPYILNQSEKGILKITKVDSTDRGVTLPDAEFALYGPYASENAVLENPDEGRSGGGAGHRRRRHCGL